MYKTYVTFGQSHTHSVNGHTLDKDSVAVLYTRDPDEGRALAFSLFGTAFCFEYPERKFDRESLKWFPRGLIHINPPAPNLE